MITKIIYVTGIIYNEYKMITISRKMQLKTTRVPAITNKHKLNPKKLNINSTHLCWSEVNTYCKHILDHWLRWSETSTKNLTTIGTESERKTQKHTTHETSQNERHLPTCKSDIKTTRRCYKQMTDNDQFISNNFTKYANLYKTRLCRKTSLKGNI